MEDVGTSRIRLFHVQKTTTPGANDITSGIYFLPDYSWPGVMERFTVGSHIVGIFYMAERPEAELGEGAAYT